jgi:hypothetical protein
MAAFCACCGAAITLKAQPCPVCGTPRHGMSQPDQPVTNDRRSPSPPQDTSIDSKSRKDAPL